MILILKTNANYYLMENQMSKPNFKKYLQTYISKAPATNKSTFPFGYGTKIEIIDIKKTKSKIDIEDCEPPKA